MHISWINIRGTTDDKRITSIPKNIEPFVLIDSRTIAMLEKYYLEPILTLFQSSAATESILAEIF